MADTLISKTIRMTPDEARELAAVHTDPSISEAQLLKQLVLRGLRQVRVERAIDAYTRDEVSLGQAVQMAKVPYAEFVDELERRHIVISDAPRVATLDALRWAGEAWGLDELRAAADRAARTEE